jgi:tricorn protease
MRLLHRSLVAVLLLGALATSASAQEPIRMARMPDISPDGKLVTFSYLGDVWVVETIGGVARPVTMHRAHDINPVFSPDGKTIAFSSNRHGSYNVYTIPVTSGKPTRLTFDSAHDYVTGWAPDGKSVLFQSTRGTDFPPGFDLYTVPADGGRTQRVTAAEGKEGVFSPDGTKIAYVRGPGTWYRKGYRGSSNDDIWVCDADGTNNRRLTDFVGQDNSPMWSADGRYVYYVSEYFGTPANVVRRLADAPPGDKPTQVTFHKDEAVRRARISANGAWIVYECGPDLWVVSTKDAASPRKLAVEVHADDKSNTERMETFTGNATEFAMSPDEKHVAFAIHGELFLMPFSPNAKATRLTHSSVSNHGIAWAPDGSRVLYVSDQGGHDNVWALTSADPAKPKIVDAQKFTTAQLTKGKDAAGGVSFAPDGKRVAFVRGGKLWTMNPDGGDQKVVVGDIQVVDYEWSPDSKWVVYSRMDGSFATELYVVPAAGPTADNPARNITRYATYNADVTWSGDGKKIAFLSARRGSNARTLFVTTLQKPSAPGVPEKPATDGKPAVEFDWDDLHLRARQVLPVPVEEASISPDGTKVAFRSTNNGQADLWVVSTDGGQLTRLTTGNLQPTQIQWSKRLSRLGGPSDMIYFRDRAGQIRIARASTPAPAPGSGSGGTPASDNLLTLPFKVKMTIKAEEEYTEMFDQAWRYLAEHFYDKSFHGADWDAVRARYRPLVKHVTMKEDLYALLYLMMGELNASHLGVTGEVTRPEEPTADLGLIYDDSYRGKGLKIKEVLKRGPADRRGINLKAGEYVVAVDGEEVTEKTDISKLLNGKENETVTLLVAADPGADPKTRRRVDVQATSRQQVAKLMYERWVEHNAKRVSELSQGKLGYIHIPSMDENGLDTFVRALYSENFDKEAIVLDVRFNGGGFTHDQVLNYLGAKEHTFFKQRDGGEGLVIRSTDRKWTKPLVLLINNRSYSDAEIFPNAFKTLNLGKVVGQPTGGFVIGTGGVQLIDGSTFRIPRIGVYTAKGVNMEKEGVMPDVLVEPHPDQLSKGVDVQLEKAVEVLQKDVVEWKKGRPNVASTTDPSTPPPPMPVKAPK